MWSGDLTPYPFDQWGESGPFAFLGDDYLADDHLVDVLRSALHEDYADASDEEVDQALSNILSSMSPAESINFASALNQIARSSANLASDPTFGAIARTALPIAGGAVGTYFGGPMGTALGSQLGASAARALPTRSAGGQPPRPGPAGVAVPPVTPPVMAPWPDPVSMAAPASVVPVPAASAGSSAATQAAVLSQNPQALQGLLAAALGQHGRREVGGVPVAQLLGMLSQVYGQAAADADELLYLDRLGDDEESAEDVPMFESDQALYTALVDADNIELAEAFEHEGLWP